MDYSLFLSFFTPGGGFGEGKRIREEKPANTYSEVVGVSERKNCTSRVQFSAEILLLAKKKKSFFLGKAFSKKLPVQLPFSLPFQPDPVYPRQ